MNDEIMKNLGEVDTTFTAHCPDCGLLNSGVAVTDKDLKRERKLPCDHCDNGGAFAKEWVNNKI